jgi:hypothetical protein
MTSPDNFPPLPSDGVPHVIDDVEGAEVDECNCIDCRVARLVEIERTKERTKRSKPWD